MSEEPSIEEALEIGDQTEIIDPEDILTVEEWREEYNLMLNNPPQADYLLFAKDSREKPTPENPHAGMVRLEVNFQMGRPPFIWGRIYLPMIVGERPNWYAHGASDSGYHGWKAILHPKSRDECIRRFGVGQTSIYVKCLKVLRRSETGQSYVVEVDKWE